MNPGQKRQRINDTANPSIKPKRTTMKFAKDKPRGNKLAEKKTLKTNYINLDAAMEPLQNYAKQNFSPRAKFIQEEAKIPGAKVISIG